MDEGRAMLTAQPEMLFTYPSPMKDYDKIGRPSLQDGVGRLTRFSTRDDPVQLPSSTSVTIQLPRPDRRAAGVTRLGPDGCFLYFDVALSSSCGFFRATVHLARTTGWVILKTRGRAWILRSCIASWCDLIVCLFPHQCPTSGRA